MCHENWRMLRAKTSGQPRHNPRHDPRHDLRSAGPTSRLEGSRPIPRAERLAKLDQLRPTIPSHLSQVPGEQKLQRGIKWSHRTPGRPPKMGALTPPGTHHGGRTEAHNGTCSAWGFEFGKKAWGYSTRTTTQLPQLLPHMREALQSQNCSSRRGLNEHTQS